MDGSGFGRGGKPRDAGDTAIAGVGSALAALEVHDAITVEHAWRVAGLAAQVGARLGMSMADVRSLHVGALLHDVGKLAVPGAILRKAGALTPAERERVALHPVAGLDIVAGIRLDSVSLAVIRHHHERWDGGGYPDGLAGTDIPLAARVFQLADIYDALTHRRPYKPARPHAEAVRVLRAEGGAGHRDPDLLALFIEVVEEATHGSRPPRVAVPGTWVGTDRPEERP